MLCWLVGGGQEQIWIRSGLDSTRLRGVVWWEAKVVCEGGRSVYKMALENGFSRGVCHWNGI